MSKKRKKRKRHLKKKSAPKIEASVKNKEKADSFYNRGVLAKRNGNIDEAVSCYRKALHYNPSDGDACYNLGDALVQQGQPAAALDMFEKAVSLNDKDAMSWNNLGSVAKNLGRTEKAYRCYLRAVTIQPDYVLAHENMGELFLTENNYARARACFQTALEIEPRNPEIYFRVGNLFKAMGDDKQALGWYAKSVELDPGFGESHFGAGLVHMRNNRTPKALQSFRQAIGSDPSRKKYWQTWARTLRWTRDMPSDEQFEKDLTYCLSLNGIDKQPLSFLVPRLVGKFSPAVEMIRTIGRADPSVVDEKILTGELFEVFGRPLITGFLENVIATDPQWEIFLTAVRARLLGLTAADKVPAQIRDKSLPFICSLAIQCYLNEYVYYSSSQENQAAARLLRDVLSLLERSDTVPTFRVALLAAYFPLVKTGLGVYADSMATASGHLKRLVDVQIRAPLTEQSLMQEIQSLTVIDDGVSSSVRTQYEENPYPRWVDAGYQSAVSLKARLSAMFRQFAGDVARAPRVLVAGCGTGRHAINCAQGYLDAHITALDLSLVSLSYGKRKALEMGIANIEFVQGDILHLKNIDGAYDMIECVGVLHHLDDPLQGWRSLLAHLKPGGLMKIGLYSSIARKGVAAVRKLIEQEGYKATTDGIRQFRFDMLTGTENDIRRQLTKPSDFYTTSACRDLYFHVKEHCFTLPRIKSILESLSLEFLGFELPNPHPGSAYREMFPDDETLTNLDNWHKFEQRYPSTFSGMYQFWVVRK